MRYKIKDIPDEGQRAEVPFPEQLLTDALEGLDAQLAMSRASASVELSRVGDDVFVRGRLVANLVLPCGRCLRPTPVDLQLPLAINFTREIPEEEDTEEVLAEEDVAEHDGDYVDLSSVLRELLIVNVPIQVRCKSDCKGLCAVCGEDRNLKDCGHDVQAPKIEESPFASLKSLKIPSQS